MSRRTLILPIGAGIIGQDDVPLVRIMDSDETPTTITVYGVVDTVQPVTGVTWTVNGVEQTGDVSRSPVLELTDLQPETSYAITLRATNINGESSASARTITTKKITTVTPNAVLDGVSYYNLDVYYTGNIPTKDENDIVVNGRDVTVPTGYYAESETVSVSSEYIIPTGTKNITDNGNEDVTQYANVNVNVQPALYTHSNVTPTTSQQTISTPTGYYGLDSVTVDGVTSAIDANIQAGNIKDGVTILGVTGTFDPTPNLDTLNVTPSTSSQTLSPTGGIDGWDEVNVGPVGASIDQNITAGNIKKDVTILGVTGTYDPQPNMTAINVVPTKQSQIITPTGGVDGFDEVNVYPVTALIDSNITPENIKKDVAILGVTGTFEGGIQPTGTLNIVNNGTYDITNYASVNVNVAAGDFNELCFTANAANCTVGMTHYGTNATTTKPVMYYSTDGRLTWTSWDGTSITLANQNDKVYFYGDNLDGFSLSGSNRSTFNTTGNLSVSGNIMTLISRYGDRETIPSAYCFYELFYRTTITDASNLLLPVTKLTKQCYMQMFYECSSLTTPPTTLPATELPQECYSYMFSRCSNLINTPTFTTLTVNSSSCFNMFNACNSLVTINCVLSATTLDNSCYNSMFSYCTSLTTAPDLPATTLADYCYSSMFQGCTSLTTAPVLPSDTLKNYCYNNMFNGCTSLNSISINVESWNTSIASNWVNNVSGSGTFIKPNALQTGSGTGQIPLDSTSGIPTGWTVYEIPSVTGDDNDYITLSISSGYDIYYTTDGTTPTTSSTLYTGPISVQGLGDTFTLKYISTDNNTFVSQVCEYTYYNMFYIEALENNTVLNLQGWSQQYSSSGQKVSYSTDKKTWTVVPRNTSAYTLANAGDKVYFRRWQNNSDTWGYGNLTGVTSGTIKIGGCLEYAVYWDITGNRPANTGCGNMFQNCTGLVDASKLTLFGTYYENMFNGCTNLTSIPNLPATTITEKGYKSMFQGCTALTTAPALPATTLDRYCYQSMFQGCTSLTISPIILPATTVAQDCYNKMFNGCTSLTTAPEIYATTFNTGFSIAGSMFYDCTNLNYVNVHCTSWGSVGSIDWLANVASTGIFIKPAELVIGTRDGQIPSNSTSGIPTGWTTVDGNMLCFTAEQANSTVGLTIPSGVNLTLYKSTDGANFDSWDGTAVTLSNVGDKLYVYGNNQTISTYNSYTHFNMTGRIAASGDVTYLLQDGGVTTLPNDYAFYILFYGCTALTTAPELPATTLTEHCYALMFNGCTNLTTAPTLPATTLASNCYEALFMDCTSLTTAPALPATTLATNCYYSMFYGCTSLTTSPELPASTLVNGCYRQMFKNCSNLNSVTCLATDISATDILDVVCTKDWLLNVSATGTFTKNPQMSSWTTGTSGIPTGWTVVDAQ